jgi:hypothetical protein
MYGVPADVVHHDHWHDVDPKARHHVNLMQHETIPKEPDTDCQNPIAKEEANLDQLVILRRVIHQIKHQSVGVVAEVCDVVVPALRVVVTYSEEDHNGHQYAVVGVKEVVRVLSDQIAEGDEDECTDHESKLISGAPERSRPKQLLNSLGLSLDSIPDLDSLLDRFGIVGVIFG